MEELSYKMIISADHNENDEMADGAPMKSKHTDAQRMSATSFDEDDANDYDDD